jgi:acetolactate synthase-1/2/3 large subunit
MKMKVSDYVLEFLKSKNIDTIFTVSGGAAAHLLNSIKEKKFNYICNYHEQACAMAAEGYAKIKNIPACVLVTNGPGSSNTITGVLGAFQDSVPMIIISGQVPTNQTLASLDKNINLRQLGVQECDIIKMVSPITKYAVQIQNASEIQHHLELAYQKAMEGRRGPVWIDIPLNIQSQQIDVNDILQTPSFINKNSENYLDEIISKIKNSKNPVIITGNGIHLSGTESKFLKLKNTLKIPVISTWTSKDLMDDKDPLFVGNFGLLGERAANFAIQNADLLLILGSRMSIPNIGYQHHLFSPKSIKIMVDIDKNELEKPTIKIDYPICLDLNQFFDDINSKLGDIPTWTSWNEKTQKWKHKYSTFLPEYKTNKNRINSFYFMEVLSKKLHDDNVIVTDMGTSYTCTMQSLKMNGKNRLFTSSGCCSMGFGLPGAIGAYYANPKKDVILIAGDGGIQMNIQEFQTVIHNKIPIKMFILNNNGYLAISLMQDNLFNGNYMGSNTSSGISSPDFCKIGNAYGLKTFKCNNNEELENQIDDVLSYNGAALCEISMTENQLLIPRVQSSKNSKGEIISTSLENMYPYLEEEEMKEIMS